MEKAALQIRVHTPLIDKDEKLLHIQSLIEVKRKMLLNKQRKLHLISKQNQFLDVVKSDYMTYHNYICQQKQEQMKALELLNTYINDLTMYGELSEHNIQDARAEQLKILGEVKKIKGSLENIMKNSK